MARTVSLSLSEVRPKADKRYQTEANSSNVEGSVSLSPSRVFSLDATSDSSCVRASVELNSFSSSPKNNAEVREEE